MLIPVLGNLVVSYCPEHDEICLGVLMEHRCESSIHIGFLNETYVEMLERENEKLQTTIDYLTGDLKIKDLPRRSK